MENIHPSCSGLESIARGQNLSSRPEVSKYIPASRWHCKTGRYERVQSCKERSVVYADRDTLLRKSRGVARLALRSQI